MQHMTRPFVQIQSLRKSYGDLEVLKGISLDADRGDVTVLLGSSGSGKSTLLRCLNLLEVPQEGSLTVADQTLGFDGKRKPDPAVVRALRKRIGMVFQQFNLWPHLSVLENVTLVPRKVLGMEAAQARDAGETLLRKVGLYDKRDTYPAFLSGGQQQRAGIARALAINPDILLFDEPTSALDPELVGEVLQVIRGLAEEGITMFVVTHEMKFARQVGTRIVYLRQGTIEAEGSPQAMFGNCENESFRKFISESA